MTDLTPEARARLETYLYMLRTETHITAQDAVWGGSGLNTKGVGSLEGDLAQCLASHDALGARIGELQSALNDVVADVLEYERVNNLSPNPGREYCWDSVARAVALSPKPPEQDSPDRFAPSEATMGTEPAPTLPAAVAALVEEAQAFLDHRRPSADRPLADDIVRRLAAALEAAARRPGENDVQIIGVANEVAQFAAETKRRADRLLALFGDEATPAGS